MSVLDNCPDKELQCTAVPLSVADNYPDKPVQCANFPAALLSSRHRERDGGDAEVGRDGDKATREWKESPEELEGNGIEGFQEKL